MLPNKTELTRTGNMGGQTVEMQFDADSINHIMSILTDLYSDPELAVLREYSTNARDSHIQSGQSRPIEISTPGAFSHNLKIKDYGTGLSVNDIVDIYSKYGASTKRGTNKQTGMLGLGCKSALTYTNQFTINAVKDGEACSVVISRTPAGGGTMEIVNVHPTNDLNGVEVIIPTKRNNGFSSKARHFLKYWPNGSVLLDEKSPEEFEGKNISSGMFIEKDSSYGVKDILVMGNVSYPISNDYKVGFDNGTCRVVIFAPMGSVDFAPSREELHYTRRTIDFLVDQKTIFSKNIYRVVQNEIDGASNHAEALKIYNEWRSYLRYNGSALGGVKYKDAKFPTIVSAEFKIKYGMKERNTGFDFSLNHHKSLVVTGFTGTNISSSFRKKTDEWIKLNDPDIFQVFFFNEFKEAEWLDNVKIVDYDTIKAIKLPKEVKVDEFKYRELKYFGSGKHHGQTMTYSPQGGIYYINPTEAVKFNSTSELYRLFKDSVILLVNKNEWKRLLELKPNALNLMQELEKAINFYVKTDYIKYMKSNIESWQREWYTRLDAARVDDEILAKEISENKDDREYLKLKSQYQNMLHLDSAAFGNKHIRYSNSQNRTNRLSEYGLLNNLRYYNCNIDEIYCYINAWYKNGIVKNTEGV